MFALEFPGVAPGVIPPEYHQKTISRPAKSSKIFAWHHVGGFPMVSCKTTIVACRYSVEKKKDKKERRVSTM